MVVMRIAWLAVSLVGLLAAQDARDIVLKAVEVDRAQLDLVRQYTFVQRVENRELDDAGAVKKVESKTFDVLNLEGTFYERLIARDDKPLSAQDERKEKEKFERNLAKRKAETPSQRARRIAEEEKEQRELRDQLRQIPDAFDLRIAGSHASVLRRTMPPSYTKATLSERDCCNLQHPRLTPSARFDISQSIRFRVSKRSATCLLL